MEFLWLPTFADTRVHELGIIKRTNEHIEPRAQLDSTPCGHSSCTQPSYEHERLHTRAQRAGTRLHARLYAHTLGLIQGARTYHSLSSLSLRNATFLPGTVHLPHSYVPNREDVTFSGIFAGKCSLNRPFCRVRVLIIVAETYMYCAANARQGDRVWGRNVRRERVKLLSQVGQMVHLCYGVPFFRGRTLYIRVFATRIVDKVGYVATVLQGSAIDRYPVCH